MSNTIYTLMYNLDSLEIGKLYTKAAFSKCGALSVLPLVELLRYRTLGIILDATSVGDTPTIPSILML